MARCRLSAQRAGHHAERQTRPYEKTFSNFILRIPESLLPDVKIHRDERNDLDGDAIQQRRAKSPLRNGIARGFRQHGIAANDLNVLHFAIG